MIVIIGAGLAGLSTASFLGRVPHKVFEREATVGGLCRSHQVDGFTFDQTGHVLHCKSAEIRRFVEKLLGNTLVSHSRHSAIYSKKRFNAISLPSPLTWVAAGSDQRLSSGICFDSRQS